MMTTDSHTPSEPKLTQTLLADIRRGDLKRTIRREWGELKEFYLDQQRKIRLQEMGWVRRSFVMTWWLIKSLFLRLTPLRRVLVVISFLFILQSDAVRYQGDNVQIDSDTSKIGFIILL